MDPSDIIRESRLLVAFTAPDKRTSFIGQAIGYYNQPVYILSGAGDSCTWAASLTREATPEEAVEYWRNRALAAEGMTTPTTHQEGARRE